MKTSSRLLIILAAIILFGAGALTGMSVVKRADDIRENFAPVTANQVQTASVLIDTSSDLLGFQNIPIQANDTVWSILDRLSGEQSDLAVESEQYQDMGVLVKSIKSFVNGADDKYWQYWVNNKYAEVAADKQVVRPGDIIMWKFTKAQFREY